MASLVDIINSRAALNGQGTGYDMYKGIKEIAAKLGVNLDDPGMYQTLQKVVASKDGDTTKATTALSDAAAAKLRGYTWNQLGNDAKSNYYGVTGADGKTVGTATSEYAAPDFMDKYGMQLAVALAGGLALSGAGAGAAAADGAASSTLGGTMGTEALGEAAGTGLNEYAAANLAANPTAYDSLGGLFDTAGMGMGEIGVGSGATSDALLGYGGSSGMGLSLSDLSRLKSLVSQAGGGTLGNLAGGAVNGLLGGALSGSDLASYSALLAKLTGYEDPQASKYTEAGLSGLQASATDLADQIHSYMPAFMQYGMDTAQTGQDASKALMGQGDWNANQAKTLADPDSALNYQAANQALATQKVQDQAAIDAQQMDAMRRGVTPGSGGYYTPAAALGLNEAGAATGAFQTAQKNNLAASQGFSQLATGAYSAAPQAGATGLAAFANAVNGINSAYGTLGNIQANLAKGGSQQTQDNINLVNAGLPSSTVGMGLAAWGAQHGVNTARNSNGGTQSGTGLAGQGTSTGSGLGDYVGKAVGGWASNKITEGLSGLFGW